MYSFVTATGRSRILRVFFITLTLSASLSGCFLTKLVSVPMRIGGAVVSIVPGVGNTAHDAIDKAAEVVDDVPV